MTDFLDDMEKILGAKIERGDSRIIPGMEKIEGMVVVYFSDNGKKDSFKKKFNNLICFTEPPFAKNGGSSELGCTVTLPEGLPFYAIEYHGDIDGWRKDIEAGAQGLGLLLAHIENDRFVVSDGRSFTLSECVVKFT